MTQGSRFASREPTPQRSARIEYVPALDGLRGLAVLAVLVYHQGYGWARGGFLGVSLFFTLSGFLITSLLLAEHAAAGSIRLRNFWIRRVRRLAPAALLGIVLALIVVAVAVPNAQRLAALTDIRAALVQVANWRFVFADATYADVGNVPSPVLHYWSLAIEEQFYVVFPLVAVACLRLGRRVLAAVLGVVALTSFSLQVGLAGADRVYFGTDTRAAELAIGCLLALAWPHLRSRVPSARTWDVVGLLALAAAVASWSLIPISHISLRSGGLVVVALGSAAILTGSLGGSALPRALSVAPLRGLGLVSYGLYVVHFPVFILMTPDRVGLAGEALFVARVFVSVLLATASLYVVERPIRYRRPVRGWILQGAPAVGVLVLCLAMLGVVTVPLAAGVPSGIRPTGLVPSEVGVEGGRAPRLVVVGDSTADANGSGLQSWAQRGASLQVSVVSSPGCAVHYGSVARYREGFEFAPTGCGDLFPVAAREAEQVDADAIVVFIGAPQLADWAFGSDRVWRDISQPDFQKEYRRELRHALDVLMEAGRPVLWADVPVPAWDLRQFGQVIGGEPPGTGDAVINSPDRTVALNSLTTELVNEIDGATSFPYADRLAGLDGVIASGDRIDGLHLSSDQVEAAADEWLVDILAQAWGAALAEFGLVASSKIAWPCHADC